MTPCSSLRLVLALVPGLSLTGLSLAGLSLTGCGSTTEVLQSGTGGSGGDADQGSSASQGGADASTGATAPGCTTNQQCIDDNGQLPHVCQAGTCVGLLAEDCTRFIGDLEALGSGDAIVIGALVPLTGPDADVGEAQSRALELALDEVHQTVAGLPDADGGRTSVGVVLCDEVADVDRAAGHLVDDVGVPLILGPFDGGRAVQLSATTVPAGVLVVSPSGDDPSLDQLDDDGLVWQAESVAAHGEALAAVAAHVEPDLSDAPVRVALVVGGEARGRAVADRFLASMTLNGVGAEASAEAGNLLVLEVGGGDLAGPAAEVVGFEPDLIVMASLALSPLVDAIEDAAAPPTWTPPTWLAGPAPQGLDDLAARLEGRLIVVRVGAPADRQVLEEASIRFQSRFGERPSFAALEAYDTGYVAFGAMAALDATARTGPAIAGAIGRLLPPGVPVRVGPSDLTSTFAAFAASTNADLAGATGTLDAEGSTGAFPRSHEVLCAPGGSLEPSGLLVDEAGTLVGTSTCL